MLFVGAIWVKYKVKHSTPDKYYIFYLRCDIGMDKPMTIWSQVGSGMGMGWALPYLHKPVPLPAVLQVFS